MNGAISDVTDYPGLTYQALRYEPLCGNIGTDAHYKASFDVTDR